MMQVSKLGGHLLFCHDKDMTSLSIDNIPHKNVTKRNSVHILQLTPAKEDIEEYFANTNNRNIQRYLDKFYLYTSDDKPERHQQVLDVFFDMISEEYDSLVDVERNCNNVRNLIGFLIEYMAVDELSMVMDYGCGTGLSISAFSNPNLKIVGIDRCPKMRKLATARGLEVWSPDELARQPIDFFSGAFASYVLHLRPHARELELLWARLKYDGVFVANFHKNHGIELINALMRELGATVQVLKSPADSEMHGAYVAYFKRYNPELFLPLKKVFALCEERFGCRVPSELIDALIRTKLLPTYTSASTQLVMREDFDSLLPVLSAALSSDNIKYLSDDLFGKRTIARIVPCRGTSIELVKSSDVDPAFCPATRNLISSANSLRREKLGEEIDMEYYSPTRLFTSSRELSRFAKGQLSRTDSVMLSKASQFAASAYYMGSKKALCGFLVEGISSVLPGDGIVVDLMCGSGAAASAFGNVWRTYASDAQKFCTTLAMVQGGGFSTEQARELLEKLYPIAHEHAGQLRGLVDTFLEWEDRLFHSSSTNPELLKEYRDFMTQFPTYPADSPRGCWNPYKEVDRRRKEPMHSPYCLFTAYFSNIYFGLRQCVEIDSLRYAIDQLELAKERQWALGALIPTLSALGTTYGGHFAQPRIGKPSDLKLNTVSKVLENRAFSVIHEFSVRLLNLAEASEKSPRCIKVIPGPWSNALSILEKRLRNKSTVVYVDPPYKREEYSRYYHVLETAIDYSYPSCIGSGKIPDKGKGERFISEFFTRINTRLTQSLVRVISEVLRRNWICAWSYADNGNADIPTVVSQVHKAMKCQVKSFATPYVHKSHGGRQHKKVTEYLILFSPK